MTESWTPDKRTKFSHEIACEGGQLLGRLDELVPFLYIAKQYWPSHPDMQRQVKGFFTLSRRTDCDGFDMVSYRGLILPIRLCRDNKVRTALEAIPALVENRQITMLDRRRLVKSRLDEAFHGDLKIAYNDRPNGCFELEAASGFFRRGYESFDYVNGVIDNPAGTVKVTKTSRFRWRSLSELVEWCHYWNGSLIGFTTFFVSELTGSLFDGHFYRGGQVHEGLERPALEPSKWFVIRPDVSDAKLGVRLEMREDGWARLHLLCGEAAATIELYQYYDPFWEMVDWGRGVDEGDLPVQLTIDEWAEKVELMALRTDDPERVLLRVVRSFHHEDVLLEGIVARADLAASFKAELKRFFTEDFVLGEWSDYDDGDGILKERMLSHPWVSSETGKPRWQTFQPRLGNEEDASFVPVLTVMADYGCAPFLWLVDCPKDRGVGRNVCDGMYWDESFPITEGLWRKFADWAREFDRTPLYHVDFVAHNARGQQLARLLKKEVGEKYRVVYVGSFEEPGPRWGDRVEFLADGDCVPLPSLYEYRPRSKPFRFCRYILSSGKTGAERAALDFAIKHGYSHGGWALPGREAADGVIASKYQLIELPEGSNRQCIRRNMGYSDGMLIVNLCEMGRSTHLAKVMAESGYVGYRTNLIVQLDQGVTPGAVDSVLKWLREHSINTLYVTGPQESERPGIYGLTIELLDAVDAVFRSDPDCLISERDPPIPRTLAWVDEIYSKPKS